MSPADALNSLPVSPLAPASFPGMPPVPGISLGAMACGLRYSGRPDLMLAVCAPGTTIAGVFTRSLTAGAPVVWCKDALANGNGGVRAIVVNSGNANAFTGRAGDQAVLDTVDAVVSMLGCTREEVFVSSTGVIGGEFNAGKIVAALPALNDAIRPDTSGSWQDAAKAITTTDTYIKGATRSAVIDGVTITLNGIAKGSGMIAPDMATMLGYIFTDARIPAAVLADLLKTANRDSFNAITVDGDTSTSDTVLLAATGQAAHDPIERTGDPRMRNFKKALASLTIDLAHQIVRDGEGATKFVEVRVQGAASRRAAHRIAMSIANSPLVKTAIAGEDANWGRIVMAVGKSGEKAVRDRLAISIGGVLVTDQGAEVVGYDEAPVTAHMQGTEIKIDVDVGVGRGHATVWTCDLTHGYIDINGAYRS